jgi:hypothetical protein
MSAHPGSITLVCGVCQRPFRAPGYAWNLVHWTDAERAHTIQPPRGYGHDEVAVPVDVAELERQKDGWVRSALHAADQAQERDEQIAQLEEKVAQLEEKVAAREAQLEAVREVLDANPSVALARVREAAWNEGALWAAVEVGAIGDEREGWLTPADNPYSQLEEK